MGHTATRSLSHSLFVQHTLLAMIIYKDLISGDEIISDVYKVTDVGSGLWEYDGKMVKKGAENFVLEGANPSAEGEDADEGGAEGGVEQVIDFVDDFRYNKIDGLDKKAYMGDVKRYMKALTKKMERWASPRTRSRSSRLVLRKASRRSSPTSRITMSTRANPWTMTACTSWSTSVRMV